MWRSAATIAPTFGLVGALVHQQGSVTCEGSSKGSAAQAAAAAPAPVWLRREFPNSASATNQASVQHIVDRMIDLYDCKYTKKHMDVYDG